MDFGKLANISNVDFRLPPDLPGNAQLLAHQKKPQAAEKNVYAGAPLWSPKEWVGRIYPLKTKPHDYLKYYSQQFNTIELNTTHYRVPDAETIRHWREAAHPGFKFCPKFPQKISHDHMLQGVEELTRTFCESVMGLGEFLGVSFLQLPPAFSPAYMPVLRKFFEALPKGFKLAVEFRHPAWFSNHALRSDAQRLLEIYGVTALITDVAGRRDVLHMSLTTPRVLIRFVGNGLHPTDYSRVDEWVERLRAWRAQGLQDIYFFVHQPEDALMPDLIAYFISKMNERCGLHLETWKEMSQGSQLSLFG